MSNKNIYLTDEKMIDLSQRAIDKQEQTFESLRNRMYWMLTITTIVLVPLLSIEKFNEVSHGWIIVLATIGSFFLFIIILFYIWFVRAGKFPIELPGKVMEDVDLNIDKFTDEYITHLSEVKQEWEKINKLAVRKFMSLMIMMLITVIGVIIFMTIGGKF